MVCGGLRRSDEAVALSTRIRKVPASNINRDSGHPGFL
jgi:hypothetical protein